MNLFTKDTMTAFNGGGAVVSSTNWKEVEFTWPDMAVRPLGSDEYWKREDWLELMVKKLFNIPRFAGASKHYTVGDHSMRVGKRAWLTSLGSEEALLFGYLHDLHESIIGDIISPMKKTGAIDAFVLGEIEAYLTQRVYDALGIKQPRETSVIEAVLEADRYLASEEREELSTGKTISFTPEELIYEIVSAVDYIKSSEVVHTEQHIPQEALDGINRIFEMGAKKYARNNWLQPDGKKSSHKEMHDSMFHHLAQSFYGDCEDRESGEHPLLHLATRAIMAYTRQVRNIYHPDDEEMV